MPITLKLATDDTPDPSDLALTSETPPPLDVVELPLEYAREGLPSAQPRSLWRSALAVVKRLAGAAGWLVGAVIVAMAFALLLAGTLVRIVFAAGAGVLLLLRRSSPFRLYNWLRYRGDVPWAQVA